LAIRKIKGFLNQNTIEPLNSDRQTLKKKGSLTWFSSADSRRPSSVIKTVMKELSRPSISNATDYSDAVMNKTFQGHFTMSTSMQQTHWQRQKW